MARVKLACRNSSKMPMERMFEMKKKLHVISFAVEGEQQINQGHGGPDEPGDEDDKDNDDEPDDLDDQNDNFIMDTDVQAVNTPRTQNTSAGSKTFDSQKAKTVPCYQKNQQDVDQKTQLELDMTCLQNTTLDTSEIHTTHPDIDILSDANVVLDASPRNVGELTQPDQQSQWEQLRKLAQDFTGHDYCKMLREMEMDDNSESDEENSEAFDKMLLMNSTKRNLIPELEECSESPKPERDASFTKVAAQPPNHVKPKKQKWGLNLYWIDLEGMLEITGL
ncbi:uncharacterized protein LOC120673847 [Panicum virgatum]|uniref:uncharacterized protein LOC120673847 n=1 Tax=Panicum virgatum TaxID=38727 RepID=UPI0019D66F30|nr:uncharacterized protein LOC120673847 [Panicum virgatum]